LTAEVHFAEGRLLVTPIDAKGSHDLAAFACGTTLVRIPAGAPSAGPGDPCEILPLVDWRQSTRQG
jgi:molybdopterin biosynthesis enzyme